MVSVLLRVYVQNDGASRQQGVGHLCAVYLSPNPQTDPETYLADEVAHLADEVAHPATQLSPALTASTT